MPTTNANGSFFLAPATLELEEGSAIPTHGRSEDGNLVLIKREDRSISLKEERGFAGRKRSIKRRPRSKSHSSIAS